MHINKKLTTLKFLC